MEFAPAKLNLFLAVTGRREDGFHDLVSLVAPLDFGDTLRAARADAGEGFSLACDDPSVPSGEDNLVLKAARAFAGETGQARGARFVLEKRVPMGAGLGGGSSDAAAALRLLNRLEGEPLPAATLSRLAAQVGSDCPLFLHGGPVIMRGRGERVEPLPAAAARRLAGRRVLVFKPAFGIPTAWAYAEMAKLAGRAYLPATEAEARIAAWLGDPAAPAERVLFNNMEAVAFRKFVALPVLLGRLREAFGLESRMSGSGSACFALLPETADVSPIVATIRDAWGASAFVIQARLA